MYNLQHIKTLAEQRKVTLKDVFTHAGMSEAGFHRSIKNGNMGIEYLDKIADFFDISVSELINDSRLKLLKSPDNVSENVGVYKKLVTTQEELINKQEKLYNSSVREVQDLKKQVEKLKNEVELSSGYSLVATPPVELKKK